MEENQQKQQKNGAGILIIIGVIVLAVAAYFIVKAVNKKDANQPSVSIAEADRLEVSPINIYGKWNKQENGSRFELNLRSTGELIYTQYDKDGNELVKSDEGTFEVENGSLRLIMTSQGAAFNELYGVVVSSRQLVLTKKEGSGLFTGAYERDMEGVNLDAISEALTSKTESAISIVESSTTTKENSKPVVESSEPESVVSKPESTASKPNSTVSEIESIVSVPEVPKEIHISNLISPYLSMTLGQVLDSSETAPISKAIGTQITLNSYTVNVWNDAYNPDYGAKLLGFSCPIQMFFTNISANPTISDDVGKESYTYNELKEMLGDSLSYEFVQDGGEAAGYVLKATIDGYTVYFGDKLLSWNGVSSLDIPFTYCQIDARQQ